MLMRQSKDAVELWSLPAGAAHQQGTVMLSSADICIRGQRA